MSKPNSTNISPHIQEFMFPQPKEKQTIGQMIYDERDGTYFGRTPSSWGKISLFYIIFYLVLAGFIAICMQILLMTLKDNEPKWKLKESLIGTNPGLGYRPLSEQTERGSVIQFDMKKPIEFDYWINLMNEFLKPYEPTGRKEKMCSFNQTHEPNQVCPVDIDSLGPCSPSNSYGYRSGRPCVFLKLNKIYQWNPNYYDDVENLPTEMSSDLKHYIKNQKAAELQQIWVSCQGLHSLDKENIGTVSYYPSRGFPAYYYPYMNQPGYLSPLIAVQFENVTLNQMVNIECRAWAKNIFYSGSSRDRQGSVTFQIFID